MTTTVNSLDIRKFSSRPEEGKEWVHYPQRSDLLINFVLGIDEARISVTWKTQTLQRVYLFCKHRSLVSIVAKYPCIGYKQKDYRGNVLGRFQVSFNDRKTYDDFVVYLRDELKLIVDDSSVANSASQSIAESFASQNWQFEPSQTETNETKCDSQYSKNIYTRNLEPDFQASINHQKQEIHRSQTFAIPKPNVAISSKLIPSKRNHTSCEFYNEQQNSKNGQSKVIAKDQFQNFLNDSYARYLSLTTAQHTSIAQHDDRQQSETMITYGQQEHLSASATPQKSSHHPEIQQLPPNNKFHVPSKECYQQHVPNKGSPDCPTTNLASQQSNSILYQSEQQSNRAFSHLNLSQSQVAVPGHSQNAYSNASSNTNFLNDKGSTKNADNTPPRCGNCNTFTAQSWIVLDRKVLCKICGTQGMDRRSNLAASPRDVTTTNLDNWSMNELQNTPELISNDRPIHTMKTLPLQSKVVAIPQVLTPYATPEKTSNHLYVSNTNMQLRYERENESVGNLQPEPNIAGLLKMDSESQREFIVIALKDPLFVKLVKRVDTILSQRSG